MKQKILFIFVILINIFSYVAVSYDKSNLAEQPMEQREVRLLTIASCGGSFGLLTGLIISEHFDIIDKNFFMNALKIIFIQNMLMIFLAVKFIHREIKPEDADKGSGDIG